MIPTGRIKFRERLTVCGQIVLGPDIVTYCAESLEGEAEGWVTRPLSDLTHIEWDDFPFQPESDEIAFLQQWVSNLSPDELEAAVEAQIGVDGMHRQGEWIKAGLLGMLPQ